MLQQIANTDIQTGIITGDRLAANIAIPVITGANSINFSDGTVMGSGYSLGMRNRIINGSMGIDQRNSGASVTNTTITNYTVDRWNCVGTTSSKFTVQQNAGSVTPPPGTTNYLGITSSSSYTLGTNEYFSVAQVIEGLNIADLNWGTANAKTVTLSFQVYSSLTGSFGGSIQNYAENWMYSFAYTVSSANTWTPITVTIPGPTSGTWNTNNSGGMYVWFGLGANGTRVGTAGAWGNQSTSGLQPTGTISLVGTSGATLYITLVQLERGTIATPFDYRDYGRELIMCQRYYEQWYWPSGGGGYVGGGIGMAWGTGQARIQIQYEVVKRAPPTCSVTGTISWQDSVSVFTQTSFIFDAPTINTTLLYGVISPTSATAGRAMQAYASTSSALTISFNSEL
jgi:hypothetical protein